MEKQAVAYDSLAPHWMRQVVLSEDMDNNEAWKEGLHELLAVCDDDGIAWLQKGV